MKVYYIIEGKGVTRQYFSEHNKDLTKTGTENAIFTPSLRNAMNFNSVEDAKKVISDMSLVDCVVIDPYGLKQD